MLTLYSGGSRSLTADSCSPCLGPPHPIIFVTPAHPPRCLPCREYNRNLLYTAIRGAIMVAIAVVFATLFIGQGGKYNSFTGEQGSAGVGRNGGYGRAGGRGCSQVLPCPCPTQPALWFPAHPPQAC